MSFGRKSVFMINILIAFVIFGILTLYLILFSRISISLISPLLPPPGIEDEKLSILKNKNLYVIAVPLILVPVMMKKSIAE